MKAAGRNRDAFKMPSRCLRGIEGQGSGKAAERNRDAFRMLSRSLHLPWPSIGNEGIVKAFLRHLRFLLEAFLLPQSALKFIPGTRCSSTLKTRLVAFLAAALVCFLSLHYYYFQFLSDLFYKLGLAWLVLIWLGRERWLVDVLARLCRVRHE